MLLSLAIGWQVTAHMWHVFFILACIVTDTSEELAYCPCFLCNKTTPKSFPLVPLKCIIYCGYEVILQWNSKTKCICPYQWDLQSTAQSCASLPPNPLMSATLFSFSIRPVTLYSITGLSLSLCIFTQHKVLWHVYVLTDDTHSHWLAWVIRDPNLIPLRELCHFLQPL